MFGFYHFFTQETLFFRYLRLSVFKSVMTILVKTFKILGGVYLSGTGVCGGIAAAATIFNDQPIANFLGGAVVGVVLGAMMPVCAVIDIFVSPK